MTAAAAPAKPFVHTPEQGSTHNGLTTFGAFTPSTMEPTAFFVTAQEGVALLNIDAGIYNRSTTAIPADLLLPLARKLVDAHHHITSQTKGTDT